MSRTVTPAFAFVIALGFATGGLAVENEKLETTGGLSTITHGESPLPPRPRQALLDNREPTEEEQKQLLGNYRLRWTATLPDPRGELENIGISRLTLRVWEPMHKRLRGVNPPVAEVWSGKNRLSCLVLAEANFPMDVWTAVDKTTGYLYVRTEVPHRVAVGECLYQLDATSMELKYKGMFFSKEELAREHAEGKSVIEEIKPAR